MAKKGELEKLVAKYRPLMKKLRREFGEVAKKGEENIVMLSKLFRIQLDIASVNLQKENLYRKIGKEVAEKLLRGNLSTLALRRYKPELLKLRTEGIKKQKEIQLVRGSAGSFSKSR